MSYSSTEVAFCAVENLLDTLDREDLKTSPESSGRLCIIVPKEIFEFV